MQKLWGSGDSINSFASLKILILTLKKINLNFVIRIVHLSRNSTFEALFSKFLSFKNANDIKFRKHEAVNILNFTI